MNFMDNVGDYYDGATTGQVGEDHNPISVQRRNDVPIR